MLDWLHFGGERHLISIGQMFAAAALGSFKIVSLLSPYGLSHVLHQLDQCHMGAV